MAAIDIAHESLLVTGDHPVHCSGLSLEDTLSRRTGQDWRPRTEELAVVLHALAVQRVQHGVPGAVSRAGTSVGLPALAKVQRLATKRALIDLALLRAREGQAVVLELPHRLWRLPAHILDCILRAESHVSQTRHRCPAS